MVRILLTGAGAPGIRGTLFALRNNPSNEEVFILGVDLKSDPIGKYFCDEFEQVIAPEKAEYFTLILDLCEKHKIDLIVPQTTRETVYFSSKKADFESRGIRVLTPTAEGVASANSKHELIKEFQSAQLPVPSSILTRTAEEFEAAVKKMGYPESRVVAKLPISNGMRGFRVLDEKPWDLKRFIQEKPSGVEISLKDFTAYFGDDWPELLVMEYLPGDEYSVDIFSDGEHSVIVPRIRNEIRSGISFSNVIEFDKEIIRQSEVISKHLRLVGIFGFQFKLNKDGEPRILECNPRIQGTMVASTFSGVNIIWLGVLWALGRDYRKHIPTQLKAARFERYWGGVGIDGDNVVEI